MIDRDRIRDINYLAQYVHEWADKAFPGRAPKASLNKLVMEEIPELLQHMRIYGSRYIEGELADCFILLLDLARIWGVDLPKAIADKMEVNEKRTWAKDEETGFYNHTSFAIVPLDPTVEVQLVEHKPNAE